MIRRLFNIASALALVLCVATLVIWVWSYRTTWQTTRWQVEPQVRQYRYSGWAIYSGRAGYFSYRSTCQHDDDFAALSADLPNTAVMMEGPENPVRLFGIIPVSFVHLGVEVESFRYSTDHVSAFVGHGMGREYYHAGGAYSNDALRLIAPLWLIALPLFLFGLPTMRHIHRKRRPGHCTQCGYDLRASNERCPECGAACKAADPAGVSPAAGD